MHNLLLNLLFLMFISACGVKEEVEETINDIKNSEEFIDYTTPPEGQAGTLSGTAATGAPIPNGIVKVKCSDKMLPEAATDAFGKWSVNVEDCQAPYLVRVNGSVGGDEVDILSVADEEDVGKIVNVTPITHIITSEIIGSTDPDDFNTFVVNTTNINKNKINTEKEKVKTLLADVIKLATGRTNIDDIDLLNTPFATNHTGLDAVLDVVRVDISATKIDMSFIDGTEIISDYNPSDVTKKLDHVILRSSFDFDSSKDAMLEAVASYAEVDGVLRALISYVKANAQEISRSSILPSGHEQIFHSDFLDEGRNRKQAMFKWFGLDDLEDFQEKIGSKQVEFANVKIRENPLMPGFGVIFFDFIVDGEVEDTGIRLRIRKESGIWKLFGDQMQFGFHIGIGVLKKYEVFAPSTYNITTGTALEISFDEGSVVGSIRKVNLYFCKTEAEILIEPNCLETTFEVGYEDWDNNGEYSQGDHITINNGVMTDGVYKRSGIESDSRLRGEGRREYIVEFVDENDQRVGPFKRFMLRDPETIDVNRFPIITANTTSPILLDSENGFTNFCDDNTNTFSLEVGQSELELDYFYGEIFNPSSGESVSVDQEMEEETSLSQALIVDGSSIDLGGTLSKNFSLHMRSISGVDYSVDLKCGAVP